MVFCVHGYYMGLGNLFDKAPIRCCCGEVFFGNQRKAMGKATDHLAQDHSLFELIEPPVQPKQAQTNVLISEKGVRMHKYHPENRNIQGEYELSTGHFLNTNYKKEAKQRYLDSLADGCGVDFEYDW
jgi:hypothetical protein